DTVAFPNGIVGELEMVRHPGASAVVPFLDDPSGDDPRILLIRQYRHASGGYLFEIPAGRLDESESPENCATRELKEETGYSAANIEHLASVFTTPGFTDERIHLFMATGLAPGDQALESDEILDLHPTPLSDALKKVSTGKIVDAKSMLGILLSARRIRA
ncbi:MAG: NUDIX hydrolase, partial [Gemmatimonadaceae bacterium]